MWLTDIIEDKSIKWPTFMHMMATLNEDAQIRYLIRIRSEKDPVKIKKFTSYDRKVYLDWRKRHPEIVKVRTPEQIAKHTDNWIKALEATGNVKRK